MTTPIEAGATVELLINDIEELVARNAHLIPCPEHGLNDNQCDTRAILVRDLMEILHSHNNKEHS